MSALDRVQTFKASHWPFVLKRQSTVKTKQNGHGVSLVVCLFFWVFFFLVLLYCNIMCELWSHRLLKRDSSLKTDGHTDDGGADKNKKDEEEGDSYWNCQQNEVSKNWPLWHWDSLTKKNNLYKWHAKDVCVHWSCNKTPTGCKMNLVFWPGRCWQNLLRQTQSTVSMAKECRLLQFI